mmetsp:Transcript_44925/g.43495  ORF Transcript_44925/g.43495 Transcript_44925/m.43495 type:complete len:179 (-) Transcript_44925:211-747(-)
MLAIIAIVIYAVFDYKQILDIFDMFIEWVNRQPYLSSLAIIAVYICLVVLTMPIMYLSIALGYAYSKAFGGNFEGYIWGFLIISIGIITGGIIAFLLSRYLFSNIIKKRVLTRNRGFFVIDRVILSEGWKIIFLIRVTPMPFSLFSYLLGITAITLREFIIGTCSVTFHIVVWMYVGA